MVYGRLAKQGNRVHTTTRYHKLGAAPPCSSSHSDARLGVQLLDWNTGVTAWSRLQTTLETALETLQVASNPLRWRVGACGLEPLAPRSMGVALDAMLLARTVRTKSNTSCRSRPQPMEFRRWGMVRRARPGRCSGATPITTTDVQDALEKIGNKLVVEKKLNKRGRTQPTFQGSGVWRNAGGTWTNHGQHVLDAGDSQPAWGTAASRSVEYKLQNQRWRDLGRIHYYRFCNLDNLPTPVSQANLATSGSRCQHVQDFLDACATPGTSTNVAPTGSPVVVDPTSPLAGYGAGALFRWGPTNYDEDKCTCSVGTSVAEWKVW